MLYISYYTYMFILYVSEWCGFIKIINEKLKARNNKTDAFEKMLYLVTRKSTKHVQMNKLH